MAAGRREGDAGTLGRNFASSAIGQLCAQGLTLLVSILLARKLDVAAYGVYVFGFAFPSWFLLLVSLGLDDVMTIDIAADHGRASRYLTTVGLLRLVLAGIAILALWAGVQLVLPDPASRNVTMVLGVSSVVTAYTNTFLSVFRGFEKFQYAALMAIVERCVTVGAAVALLLLGAGLLEVSYAFLGGAIVMLLLSVATVRRKFTWFSRTVRVRDARGIVRSAVPFALNNVVATFTYTPGLVLLSLMENSASTGIFNAAFTIVLGLFSFLSLVSLVVLPTMSRIRADSSDRFPAVLNQLQRLCVIVGVPLAIGGWLYAGPIITLFYGDAFAAAAPSFQVLIVSIAVETTIMGIGPALAATGHMQARVNIGAVAAALSIALSVWLIPSLGPLGVAYAFLASCLVSAGLSVLVIRRYVAPVRVTRTLAKSILAGSAMAVVLLAFPELGLYVGVPLGALVYFAVLFSVRGFPREDRMVVWKAIHGVLAPMWKGFRRFPTPFGLHARKPLSRSSDENR